MENNYEQWTLEQLLDRQEALIDFIEHSQSMISRPGGWIAWNGDNEDRAKRDLRDVQRFIQRKQYQSSIKDTTTPTNKIK